jgi:hypothetical protein
LQRIIEKRLPKISFYLPENHHQYKSMKFQLEHEGRRIANLRQATIDRFMQEERDLLTNLGRVSVEVKKIGVDHLDTEQLPVIKLFDGFTKISHALDSTTAMLVSRKIKKQGIV